MKQIKKDLETFCWVLDIINCLSKSNLRLFPPCLPPAERLKKSGPLFFSLPWREGWSSDLGLTSELEEESLEYLEKTISSQLKDRSSRGEASFPPTPFLIAWDRSERICDFRNCGSHLGVMRYD